LDSRGRLQPVQPRTNLSTANGCGYSQQGTTSPAHHHNAHEHASCFWYHNDPWCDVNLAYTYDLAYKQVLGEVGREPIRPVYLGETGYEKNYSGGRSNVEPFDAAYVRRQAYWTLLSGGAGHAFGHAKIWCFAENWKDYLDDPGTKQMRFVREFFEERPWFDVKPDLARPWLLGGGGQFGSAHYAATAITPDKKHALVYLPLARAIKLDLDYFPSSPRVCWFDPQTGEYHEARNEAVLKPPLEADAVLILES
jgi:hypothetical protein